MPDIFPWSVLVAFSAGTLRALLLWRASGKVEVINAVVLSTLAEGRGADLPKVLRASGSALYLDVARAITQPTDKLFNGSAQEVRKRLHKEAMAALVTANRQLRKHAWLDGVTVAAIALGVVGVLVDRAPDLYQTLTAVAISLLWLSNVKAARNIAIRMYAAATALVDSLVEGLDDIRRAADASSVQGAD